MQLYCIDIQLPNKQIKQAPGLPVGIPAGDCVHMYTCTSRHNKQRRAQVARQFVAPNSLGLVQVSRPYTYLNAQHTVSQWSAKE